MPLLLQPNNSLPNLKLSSSSSSIQAKEEQDFQHQAKKLLVTRHLKILRLQRQEVAVLPTLKMGLPQRPHAGWSP